MLDLLTLSDGNIVLATVVVGAMIRVKEIGVLADPVSIIAIVRASDVVYPDILQAFGIKAIVGVEIGIVGGWPVALGIGVGSDAVPAQVCVCQGCEKSGGAN